MMPALNSALNTMMLAVSSSLAASILVKVTVTTALGLMGARLARRSRAAVRHAVLASSFAVLLVLPIASVVSPPVRIAVPPAAQVRPAPAAAVNAIPSAAPAQAGLSTAPAASPSADFPVSALLLAAWIAGAVLFLLRGAAW
jgi:hypothetical protein